jgi:hypothetical protein
MLIPIKAVTDSGLIPGRDSVAMLLVAVGVKRRWRSYRF